MLQITITATVIVVVVAFRSLANGTSSLLVYVIMAAHDTTIRIVRSADGM